MHADYWIIQVWQRQRTAGLIYMYIPSIIKTSSKTLLVPNQVQLQDNFCPKLLTTRHHRPWSFLSLPALRQFQPWDKYGFKTSPALRQGWPKSAWTCPALRYFFSFSAFGWLSWQPNCPKTRKKSNNNLSFIVLELYRFAQKLQFPVLFGKLTIFHATPKITNFDTL